jgi:hypothetical protein
MSGLKEVFGLLNTKKIEAMNRRLENSVTKQT